MASPPPLEIYLGTEVELPSSLVWGNLMEYPNVDVSVFGGDRLLVGVHLCIEGRRVRLSQLRLDANKRGGQLLELVGTEAIEVDDLILTNTPEVPRNKGSRVQVGALKLTAAGPSVHARVKGLLLLDHLAVGSVRVGGMGGGSRFAEVLFQQGRAAHVKMPAFVLGEVDVFSAGEMEVMGSGSVVSAMPSTLVLEAPVVSPEDPARLAAWRADLGG